jgi:hypothetical protein
LECPCSLDAFFIILYTSLAFMFIYCGWNLYC